MPNEHWQMVSATTRTRSWSNDHLIAQMDGYSCGAITIIHFLLLLHPHPATIRNIPSESHFSEFFKHYHFDEKVKRWVVDCCDPQLLQSEFFVWFPSATVPPDSNLKPPPGSVETDAHRPPTPSTAETAIDTVQKNTNDEATTLSATPAAADHNNDTVPDDTNDEAATPSARAIAAAASTFLDHANDQATTPRRKPPTSSVAADHNNHDHGHVVIDNMANSTDPPPQPSHDLAFLSVVGNWNKDMPEYQTLISNLNW
jgi:hypothetical protein